MRIIFDARGVQRWSDGLSTYVRQTLTHVLRLDAANEYVVLLSPAFHEELAPTGVLERPNVRPVVTSIPFMGALQQLRMPWLIGRFAPSALYHYPHFDMPLFAHPRSVVTIYDLNHISFTGYFDSLRGLKRFYSAAATAATLARARHIMTISNTTKSELIKRFPRLDPARISVIYLGLSERFRAAPPAADLALFRRKFGLGDDRFILYVGTHRPHKNLERLLSAYALLRRGAALPHKLLLVGTPREDGRLASLIDAHALNGWVTHLGYLSSEELPLAYRASEAFAFCSLSEGFGIPLLEAMASRLPIVTSNFGAMAEVASDSAVLVDPFSPEAIADGLRRVLTSDTLRQELIARGLARAQEFAWDAAARRTLEIYAHVARDGDQSCPSS